MDEKYALHTVLNYLITYFKPTSSNYILSVIFFLENTYCFSKRNDSVQYEKISGNERCAPRYEIAHRPLKKHKYIASFQVMFNCITVRQIPTNTQKTH